MKNYIGIDIGGTFIKGGIISQTGKILYNTQVKTEASMGADRVMDNVATLVETLLKETNLSKCEFDGVGVGVPGIIDEKNGVVVLASNFNWTKVKLAKGISERIGLKVKMSNDANVAALGEATFGAGQKYDDSVLVTLGTGVGGGIIINKKIYSGGLSAGAEIGHMIIRADGVQCGCGAKGCFEAYASATALIRQTKEAMQQNEQSLMWQIGSLDKVDGKTAFDYAPLDLVAKKVVEEYIKMLGVGLINVINIFRPQVIMLGGGVCNQGDNLIVPLNKFVNENCFANGLLPEVPVVVATLGNKAGFIGAAALYMV